MKRAITICATGGEHWIGGLYHRKNIAFSLMCNPDIQRKYKIIIIANKKYKNVFSYFEKTFSVYYIKYTSEIGAKIKAYSIAILNNTKFFFANEDLNIIKKVPFWRINWVPDFQHYHYPDFFDVSENQRRRKRDIAFAESDEPLLLSSYDCKNDFEEYCAKRKNKIYVMPFVSFIEPELRQMSSQVEEKVLNGHQISGISYACISNQFWQHKNHVIVFQAIKLLSEQYPDNALKFVFTGLPKDTKKPEYNKELEKWINDPEIKRRSCFLGFLDRMEQLIIMKYSSFLIQPSLFEGWGTVVEDGKVLDKLILMSDIPVHHEQMNENCILFDPHNPNDLLEKIIHAQEMRHVEDIEKGISNMYERAQKYSEEFHRLLKDYE